MKTPLLIILAGTTTLLAGTSFAAEPSATEQLKSAADQAGAALQRAGSVVAEEASEAWTKSKGYLSDDPATYRAGATQKLTELRGEIDRLQKNSANVKDRTYFTTRMQTLQQHHDYAKQQLAALKDEDIQKGREGSRRAFDSTVERLDEHVDVAQKEVHDFGTQTQ